MPDLAVIRPTESTLVTSSYVKVPPTLKFPPIVTLVGTFKEFTVAIPVIFRELPVKESRTISSPTYKSPPTYKSLVVVTIPVRVDNPDTLKLDAFKADTVIFGICDTPKALVAVLAVPVKFPVTLPIRLPVTLPVKGPINEALVVIPVTTRLSNDNPPVKFNPPDRVDIPDTLN